MESASRDSPQLAEGTNHWRARADRCRQREEWVEASGVQDEIEGRANDRGHHRRRGGQQSSSSSSRRCGKRCVRPWLTPVSRRCIRKRAVGKAAYAREIFEQRLLGGRTDLKKLGCIAEGTKTKRARERTPCVGHSGRSCPPLGPMTGKGIAGVPTEGRPSH
ncbi:hypothetical protein AAVH_04620 [Aphelenchoides avenae]|nr:hypothetical protein AAVH_04620 [Aphelenchus avenae]